MFFCIFPTIVMFKYPMQTLSSSNPANRGLILKRGQIFTVQGEARAAHLVRARDPSVGRVLRYRAGPRQIPRPPPQTKIYCSHRSSSRPAWLFFRMLWPWEPQRWSAFVRAGGWRGGGMEGWRDGWRDGWMSHERCVRRVSAHLSRGVPQRSHGATNPRHTTNICTSVRVCGALFVYAMRLCGALRFHF